MTLVDGWNRIERGLDPRWSDARLVLEVADPTRVDRAAALLAPAGPGKSGTSLRFDVARSGARVGPEAVRRLFRRLDAEGIDGTLALVGTSDAPAAAVPAPRSLAEDWDGAVAALPADWSDLLAELELTSSDHLDVGALLLGPANPLRESGGLVFRFRVAHSFGYGVSQEMLRRCLGRLDETEIPGSVRILRVLCDTHPVGTQGPVWYVDGKAV